MTNPISTTMCWQHFSIFHWFVVIVTLIQFFAVIFSILCSGNRPCCITLIGCKVNELSLLIISSECCEINSGPHGGRLIVLIELAIDKGNLCSSASFSSCCSICLLKLFVGAAAWRRPQGLSLILSIIKTSEGLREKRGERNEKGMVKRGQEIAGGELRLIWLRGIWGKLLWRPFWIKTRWRNETDLERKGELVVFYFPQGYYVHRTSWGGFGIKNTTQVWSNRYACQPNCFLHGQDKWWKTR